MKTFAESHPELTRRNMTEISFGINRLVNESHGRAREAGWYADLETGQELQRNVPEMLMLTVSEIAEAMEGYRKDLMDDKLSDRPMIEVELADTLIRIADLAGYLKLDLAGAVVAKMQYNSQREDHRIENRLKDGGKKF